MAGHLVLVVGPSGAGKDSLIGAAKEHFAGDSAFFFPRRMITRQAPHLAEDHDSISPEAFAKAEKWGDLFLHWQAHGLSYGLPATTGIALRGGRVVVANVSRTILPQISGIWPRTTVVLVTASPENLAARVVARARPDDGDVQKRISRKVEEMPVSLPRITIQNEDTLAEATTAFCAALAQIRDASINHL